MFSAEPQRPCTGAIYAAEPSVSRGASRERVGVLCWRRRRSGNRKPGAYLRLKRPTLGPRLSGLSRVGDRLKSANKLLTGDPGTIDIIQNMETLCD